jgi:hypothetical protein
MAVAILNHVLVSGNEVSSPWDGRRVRKMSGRLVIMQRALREYRRSASRTERLHSMIEMALDAGGAVEDGILDAGTFLEYSKSPAWRDEFIALGGDPDKVLAKAEKRPSYRVRVFLRGVPKPKGERVAPTPKGGKLVRRATA